MMSLFIANLISRERGVRKVDGAGVVDVAGSAAVGSGAATAPI
jgi:hypothetical protein